MCQFNGRELGEDDSQCALMFLVAAKCANDISKRTWHLAREMKRCNAKGRVCVGWRRVQKFAAQKRFVFRSEERPSIEGLMKVTGRAGCGAKAHLKLGRKKLIGLDPLVRHVPVRDKFWSFFF